jgi:cystathionine beta-lyase
MADKPTSIFDEEIDRRQVAALKVHPMVVGKDGLELFAGGVADMDFKAPPVVLEAMAKRLQHGVFGYEAVGDGLFPALVKWQADRHGWQLDKSHILRAPNVLNILAIAASLFSQPGDGVIVQPPVFFDFFDVLRENHRTVVENRLKLVDGRYEMDFDDLEHKASDRANKMIYLCNPHNPVGRVWTGRELTRLGDICARHNVLVVSDEIHGDIVFDGHKFTPFAALGDDYADNCISCLSPAKSFNIAACCSAFSIIANEDRRRAFGVENSRLTVNKNNAFANAAMQAAYADGAGWLDEVVEYLAGNVDVVRGYLADLPDVDMIEPEGTFLLWLDFRKTGLGPKDLTKFLRQKAGWAVTRGHSFGRQGEGFARLNIATPRARLEQAMQTLAGAF